MDTLDLLELAKRDHEILKEAAREAGLGEYSASSEKGRCWRIKTLDGFVGEIWTFYYNTHSYLDGHCFVSVVGMIFNRIENLDVDVTIGGERFPVGQVPKAKFVDYFRQAARWIEEHLDHEYIEQLRGNDRRAKRWAEEINKRGK